MVPPNVAFVHYGCGSVVRPKWLNLDIYPAFLVQSELRPHYQQVSLAHVHPFPDNSFAFAYCEDLIEHLSQSDSLTFLTEVFRTLKEGGVFRLSSPGLRGVLRRHYRAATYSAAIVGKSEAYTPWGHVHFYCEESLELVARHIGFRNITFHGFGESQHDEFRGMDTRQNQADLNLFAELTK